MAQSTLEIDVLLDGKAAKRGKANPDDLPVLRPANRGSVTEQGDLWRLGLHRLLCGDSRDPASFATLMDDDRARMVFSEPSMTKARCSIW